MRDVDVNKLVKYWAETAMHDYDTMIALFKSKRYSDSLFYGHIVLEKILKGLFVKNNRKQAPYIHNLVRLQDLAKLDLSEDDLDLLGDINDFNLRARYPEHKLDFYKKCTKRYTEYYFDKIRKIYKELCQRLNQKK